MWIFHFLESNVYEDGFIMNSVCQGFVHVVYVCLSVFGILLRFSGPVLDQMYLMHVGFFVRLWYL